jgi:hypothetical protein
MKIALKEADSSRHRPALPDGLPVLGLMLRAKKILFGFDRRTSARLRLGVCSSTSSFQPFALSLEERPRRAGWIILPPLASLSPLRARRASSPRAGPRQRLATFGVLSRLKGDSRTSPGSRAAATG